MKYDLKTFHPDASISERQRQIMFYLAYISGRISYVSDEGLKRFLKTFKIAEKDFRKDITELCAMGLVEIFSFDCQISPREYFTYAVYLAAKEKDILSKLLSRIRIINPYRWSIACGVADIICGREPSRVALDRILKMGATAWNQKYDTEMFLPVRDIDEFKPYIEAFDSTLASEDVILPVLEKMLLGDSFSHETLSAMEDSIRKNSIGKALPIVRAYRYLYDGTLDPLQKDEKNPYTLCTHALDHMVRGDTKGAWDLFSKVLSLPKGPLTDKDGLINHPLYSFYMVLCLLRLGREDILSPLRKKDWRRSSNFMRVTRPAVELLQRGNSMIQEDRRLFWAGSSASILFRELGTILSGKYDLVSSNGEPLDKVVPHMGFLRSEYMGIFEPESQEREYLERKFRGKAPLAAFTLRSPWEDAIGDVDVMINSLHNSSSTESAPESRIIYVVDAVSAVPYLQKKEGEGWGAAEKILPKVYFVKDIPGMTQLDEMIRDHVKRDRQKYIYLGIDYPMETILPDLAGSDRVFSLVGSKLVNIPVEKEEPYLRMDSDEKGVHIYSNISPDGKPGLSIKGTPRSGYRIVNIDKTRMDIIRRILSVQYPPESKKEVERILGRLDGVVDVKNGPRESEVDVPRIKGESKITVRLWPGDKRNSYEGEIETRPYEYSKESYLPGEGPRELFYGSGNTAVRVTRDFKEERERLRALLDNFESITGPSRFEVDLQTLFDMISFCMDRSDQYIIEWPRGGSIRIAGNISSFKTPPFSIRSHGGWFNLEGGIHISEDRMIDVDDILRMANDASAPEGFIRIGEGEYARLSSTIKRQLQRLSAMANSSGGTHYRFTSAHAGALSDLFSEGGLLAPDKKFSGILSKIRAADSLKIEVPSKFKGTMRDYQEDGFRWMVRLSHWGAGACLADDMGLGKTVQSIALLLYKESKGPSLVVAPASVKSNWKAELGRFAPSLKAIDISSPSQREALLEEAGPGDVVICSYGILSSCTKKKWNTIILDEGHTIKNRETKMSEAAMKLKGDTRVILTGTPVQNHLGELWNLFQFMNPGFLGDFDSFVGKFIVTPDAESKRRVLKRLVSPFILRRLKSDVASELPPKTEIVHYVDLSEREMDLYESMRVKAREALSKEGNVSISVLSLITKLRQVACSPSLVRPSWNGPHSKSEEVARLVRDVVSSGNNALVFSQFTSYLAEIRTILDEMDIQYLYMDGSTPTKKREKLVDSFQRGERQVFLASLKAGGLGLNLTQANYVLILDPWWNPAIEEQASDRAYRIGQKRNVTIYRLISRNTIEEKMLVMHEDKKKISDFILQDAEKASSITYDQLLEMLSEGSAS